MFPRWVSMCAVLALLSCWSGSGSAQEEESTSAEIARLRKEGKSALKDGRLDEAVKLFRKGLDESESETSTWHMLLGLALAHELKEDWVLSATHYQAFLSRSAAHPKAQTGRWAVRRRSATEDVAKMEPDVLATHALVSVTTDPAGALVDAPGTPKGLSSRTPVSLYLLPGQHQLELTRSGFAPLILVVSVEKGQRVTVQRSLVPLEPSSEPVPVVEPPPPEPTPDPVPVAPSPKEPPPPEPSIALEALGWTMAGVGVAGLGVGVGFVVAAKGTADDIEAVQAAELDEAALAEDARLRDTLRDQQAVAAAFFAGGGALAIGGALVLLLRPGGPIDVQPTVGLGRLGVRGHF